MQLCLTQLQVKNSAFISKSTYLPIHQKSSAKNLCTDQSIEVTNTVTRPENTNTKYLYSQQRNKRTEARRIMAFSKQNYRLQKKRRKSHLRGRTNWAPIALLSILLQGGRVEHR